MPGQHLNVIMLCPLTAVLDITSYPTWPNYYMTSQTKNKTRSWGALELETTILWEIYLQNWHLPMYLKIKEKSKTTIWPGNSPSLVSKNLWVVAYFQILNGFPIHTTPFWSRNVKSALLTTERRVWTTQCPLLTGWTNTHGSTTIASCHKINSKTTWCLILLKTILTNQQKKICKGLNGSPKTSSWPATSDLHSTTNPWSA